MAEAAKKRVSLLSTGSQMLTPSGYIGNLTEAQTTAVAGIKQELTNFAQTRRNAPVKASTVKMNKAAKPTDPPLPGTPSEESEEAEAFAASESDMLRFLRARDFNVAKASAMALDTCKWRASVKPKHITPAMIPNAMPSGVWRLAGFAKSGMPIVIVDAGKWKPSIYYGADEYMRYVAYVLEAAVAVMGPGVERVMLIVILGGFSWEMMMPFATKCLKAVMQLLDKYYPERLGYAVCVNAPSIFTPFFNNVMRHFTAPETFAKIGFADKNDPTADLLKLVDKAQLSKDVGGDADYPVPTRSMSAEVEAVIARMGGSRSLPVATTSQCLTGFNGELESILDGSEASTHSGKIDIPAGQAFTIKVPIESSTKSVSWNFRVAAYDIGFAYKVLPIVENMPQKVEGYQEGSVDIDEEWEDSMLLLVFDNKHSRVRSKTIVHSVTVTAKTSI